MSTPSEEAADEARDEIAQYREQVRREMEDEERRMNAAIEEEMAELARQNGIRRDPDTGDWVEANPDAEINQSINMKDLLEFMNKLRQILAGPLPGEPKSPFNLRKNPPDNEGDSWAIKVGGKRKKKRKKKTKKRKRKHRKKRTRRKN